MARLAVERALAACWQAARGRAPLFLPRGAPALTEERGGGWPTGPRARRRAGRSPQGAGACADGG